jgi:hypothetical protein
MSWRSCVQDVSHAWRAAEIATTICAHNVGVALDGLTALEQAGLVPVDGNGLFRYGPASPMPAETVRNVVELDICNPVVAVTTILASPSDKLEMFADAFRLTK